MPLEADDRDSAGAGEGPPSDRLTLQNGQRSASGSPRVRRAAASPTASPARPEAARAGTPRSDDGGASASSAPSEAGDEPAFEQRRSFSHSLKKSLSSVKYLFNPRNDNDAFHALFKQIPEDEVLLDDFSCALQRDILVHGRLYVTQNFLCFYSNILRWETMLTLSCRDVVAIRKEKIALVIPNAIQICTTSTKYTFASFMYRDSTFQFLFRIWQNSLLHNPLSVEELLGTTSEAAAAAKPKPRKMEAAAAGAPAALAEVPVEAVEAGAEHIAAAVAEDSGLDPSSGNSGSLPAAAPAAPAAPAVAARAPSMAEHPAVGPVKCGCPDHFGRVLVDMQFNCNVDILYRLLFSDSEFFRNLYDSRNTQELEMSDWSVDAEGTNFRRMSYSLALTHPLGPKRTTAQERQWEVVHPERGRRYIIEAQVNTPNVPQGESFCTVSRYCLTYIGPKTSHLRVSSEIRYPNGPPWAMIRSMIERNSYDGLRDYFEHLSTYMTEYIESADVSSLLDDTAMAPRVSVPPSPGPVSRSLGLDGGPTQPGVPAGVGVGGRGHSRSASMSSAVSEPAMLLPGASKVKAVLIQKQVVIVLLLVLLLLGSNVMLLLRVHDLEYTVQTRGAEWDPTHAPAGGGVEELLTAADVRALLGTDAMPPADDGPGWRKLFQAQQRVFKMERARWHSHVRELVQALDHVADLSHATLDAVAAPSKGARATETQAPAQRQEL